MLCYGVYFYACTRMETEKVCCTMDCWEYSFPLQVVLPCEYFVDGSFAALQGPMAYIKHLISPTRIPFTVAYFGSLGMTLYFAVGVPKYPFSTLLTIVTFQYSDFDFGDCSSRGTAKFLRIICPWWDFKFTCRGQNSI